MLNLFKNKGSAVDAYQEWYKAEQEAVEVITAEDIRKDMWAKVEEVNDPEYLSNLKDKVSTIKDANREVIDKASMAQDLGFTNTPCVAVRDEVDTLTRDMEAEAFIKEQEIAHIEQYKSDYPLHKFVPETVMDEILEKYSLIMGEPADYIKEIPDVHLERISKFPISFRYDLIDVSSFRFSPRGKVSGRQVIGSYNTVEEVEVSQREWAAAGSYAVVDKVSSLHIVAPKDHFKIPDNKELVNNRIQDKKVEDPIALHKVDGGYVVITAWDKEAEIPEIQNPLNN